MIEITNLFSSAYLTGTALSLDSFKGPQPRREAAVSTTPLPASGTMRAERPADGASRVWSLVGWVQDLRGLETGKGKVGSDTSL